MTSALSRLRQAIAGAVDLSSGGPELSAHSWIAKAARTFPSDPCLTDAEHAFCSLSDGRFDAVPPRRGLSIVADVEIHNRADLIRNLSSGQISPSCSDASLILAAYEKWGEDCPRFLLGEFSFAIWDANRKRLFCCRDHMGQRPFFYWTNGSRLAFSSDPLVLFSLPGIGRELNREKLGSFAVNKARSLAGQTFFRDIFSLESATTLTFAQSGLTKRRYWHAEEGTGCVSTREEEAFEALREILLEAVACRLRGKERVAAFFSGGLDSSSLVALAARCLEKSNRSIIALAGVLPEQSKPQFRDERAFIDEFRDHRNVTIEYVAPDEHAGPFDGIEDPASFYYHPLRFSRQYLYDALQKMAISAGAETILFGVGGEAGATTWARTHYIELASRLRWCTLGRELLSSRSLPGHSTIRLFAGQVRRFLAPSPDHHPHFFLAPDYLRTIERADAGFHWPDHHRDQLMDIQEHMNLHPFRPLRLASRIPTTFPLLDKRVLEFCLAAPGHMKVRNGYPRYLIRRALDGILPRKIQWRTDKQAFSPDYAKRYLAQRGKARDFVAAIGPHDPVRQIVDVDRLRHILSQPNMPRNQVTALVYVPVTIYVICFLRQFVEFRL